MIEKGTSQSVRPTACMLGYFNYEFDMRVQNYVNILTDHGYSVDVLCLGKEDYISVCPNGVSAKIHAIQERTKTENGKFDFLSNIFRFSMKAAYVLTSLYKKRQYEFIHVHNVPDFLVFTALIAKLRGAKVVLDIHDILPEFYARKFDMPANSGVVSLLKLAEKVSCRFADHVIIANDCWRDLVARRSASPEKCTAIINFPDSRLFHAGNRKKWVKNECFKIFYHGSYTEHHGLDIALKAMAILKDKIDNFRFILYGKGPYEPVMRDMIADLKLGGWVSMRAPVPLEEIPLVLREADLGIVPKKDGIFVGEALSTKLFQYTSMGIPSVVSRTPAEMRYFGEDEVKYFHASDPVDLACCIREMYEDDRGRERFGQKALDKSKNYTLEATAKHYMRIIESLHDRPK